MNKQEFREFCHLEFLKRGFKKYKKMYWLQGKDFLCGLYLQKSMADAYYVEYNFFVGQFDSIKEYPTVYESDISKRIEVLSKDTVNGEHFMDACIEFELYSKEEIKLYFDRVFEEHIMPTILNGKEFLINDMDYYYMTLGEKINLHNKLGGVFLQNRNKIK